MESHLEVGTQFLEVEPEQELTFYHEKGDLYTRFNLKNITEKANVAFYVYTSSKERIYILPSQGFIQPGFEQTIQVAWAAADNPDDEKLERMLFFVKALPLSSKMDIEQMNQNLPRVFNTYNLNILFTVASLPTKVTMVPMPNLGAVPNQQVKTIKHRDDIMNDSDDDDEEDDEAINIGNKQNMRQGRARDAQKSMKQRQGTSTKKELEDDSVNSGIDDEDEAFAQHKGRIN